MRKKIFVTMIFIFTLLLSFSIVNIYAIEENAVEEKNSNDGSTIDIISNGNSNDDGNSDSSDSSDGSDSQSVDDSSESDKPNAEFMVSGSYVSCGSSTSPLIKNIPSIIPRISSSLYNTVMVIVPVIMILMGMLDLIKGILSQKEDEIRKGRSSLVKRLIMGFVTFLVVMIVKLFVSAVAMTTDSNKIVDCIDCFVSNTCNSNEARTPSVGPIPTPDVA